jgi:four helix bundle protein
MNNQVNNLQTRSYSLEELTALFAENVIHFVKKLKVDIINRSLIEQVVSSSGSIGANYCEANEAESKRDFIHKIGIAKKDVKETQYWLRILESSNISFKT